MHIENDGTVAFSTGRRRPAHGGIIGIDGDPEVFDGYDGEFFRPQTYETPEEWEQFGRALTASEQVELADFMLARWQAFRDRALRAQEGGT